MNSKRSHCGVANNLLKYEYYIQICSHCENFRAIIYHNFRRELSRQECFDELKSIYGDEASSLSTIKKLVQRIQSWSPFAL